MSVGFNPRITVILPVRNEEKYLQAAVQSVLSQDYPGEIEVLLAIAPSIDSTKEVATQICAANQNIKIIDNPKGLTTTGMNLAIAEATGEVIVRVDAHSELAAGYLARGVEILRETDSVLVGGIMNARGKSPLQSAVAFGYGSRFGLGGGRYHLGGEEGEAESAYLGIFDTQALRSVGGYDEGIIRGEDWDLAQRLKRAGGRVWFSPELIVDYWPRSSAQALAKQFYSTGIWRGELTRRAPSKASIRYFIPPLALLVFVVGVLIASLGLMDPRILIVPIALYLLLLTLGAATASKLRLLERLMVFVALPIMHLSWAFGFWIGFLLGARGAIDSGENR